MKSVLQHLTDQNPEAVVICGFDDCLVGTATTVGSMAPVAVYSTPMIVDKLQQNGLDSDDAWEHYYTNIEIVDMGPHSPIMLNLEMD